MKLKGRLDGFALKVVPFDDNDAIIFLIESRSMTIDATLSVSLCLCVFFQIWVRVFDISFEWPAFSWSF